MAWGKGAWMQQQQQQQPRPGGAVIQPQIRPPNLGGGPAAAWNQQRPWGAAGGAGAQARPPMVVGKGAVVPGVMAAAQGPEIYNVSTSGQDGDEVVIKTLVGQFHESGNNHGRKVYKKVLETSTAESVDVFMYYWDQRDGPTFEGWWFGNKVGGTQVWSHNASQAMAPPTNGWKIPWDGAVRPTLSVNKKAATPLMEAQGAVKAASSEIVSVSNAAKTALQQAKVAAGGYLSMEGLKQAETLLQPQLTALAESMKKLTEAQRGSTPEALRQITQLRTALQTLMSGINVELGKIRSSKGKAEQAERDKVADERDLAVFMEVLPEATQKANAAEDAVEKAIITSEMITAGGDDLEEVKEAVAATEQAMQEAQKAMGEARIFLNAKQASARRFESDKVKAKAATDLGQLQSQLQEAQNKLNPLKNIRQEFIQKQAATKIVAEVLEKLSPAEVDVDRAEEATALLKDSGTSKELMQQATTAVTKASDHISQVMRFIESKMRASVGKAKEELVKLEERARGSMTRITEFKNSQKEATERLGVEALVKEATDKLQTVAQAVSKAADAEGPWLMGVEELPLEESVAAVKACEAAATAANTAASIARMFIATKLVEAKRFTADLSTEATTKLKAFQADLETHTKKLAQLKKNTSDRKTGMTMREAEHEIKKAEELSAKVAEVGAVLLDDEKLAELSSEDLKKASEETIKAEQVATKHLSDARKFLTARQIEAKAKDTSSDVSSELIKCETRLKTAQTEVAKYKKAASTVDQRLAAKKGFEDAQAKLQAVGEKLEKLKEMSENLDKPAEKAEGSKEGGEGEEKAAKESQEKSVQKNVRAAEQYAADVQASLKAASRFVDMQMRSQTAIKDIESMKPQIDELQEKLDATVASMRERSEKAVLETIRSESEGRVQEVGESIKKLAEAEKPFLEDAKDLPADQVPEALTALEAAVAAANSAVSGAKTLVGVKKLAARRLSEASKKSAEEQLKEVAEKLEEHAKALAETKKKMNDRKMEVVKKEVVAKVEEAEKKVQESEEATAALTNFGKPEEEKAEGEGEGEKTEGEKKETKAAPPAADDMKAACEKAGSAQQEAKNVVTASQKLLLARQKDAKLANANSPLITEISELLDKFTKMLATLDKQKVALRDQEHRFVAQRLHKDATEKLEELEKKHESVLELASPLTSDDGGMAAVVFLGHAVDSLKACIKADSKTPKDLFTELCAGKGGVTEEAFVAKMKALEEKAPEEMLLSEEQLKAGFKYLAGKDSDVVTEERFLDEFTSRYLCAAVVTMTDGMVIKGGKTVRKIEVNEVLKGLGEPEKEKNLGLMRVHVKADKDGKEGYITVAGNQGSVYLESYTPYAAMQKNVEQAIKELTEAVRDVNKYLDTKAEELKAVRSGPLADTKAELMKFKPRLTKVQTSYTDLRKKIAQEDKKLSQVMEEEKKKRIEAADKKAAAALIEEVVKMVSSAEECVGKCAPGAESLISSLGGDEENPLASMDNAEKELNSAQETLEATMNKIKEQMEGMKSQPAKGAFAEAKNSLVKLKVKVGAMESKCKKLVAGLKTARSNLTSQAEEAILKAFQQHAKAQAAKPDDLFKELAAGADAIPAAAFRDYLNKIPDSGLKESQLDMAMGRFTAGLTKLSLLEQLQEFQRCVKEIAMTSSLEVKDGKTLKKLAKDDVLEVLETGKTEGTTSLTRYRCRAISDGKEGWVTSIGNQGTGFLEKTLKPFFCCEVESPLHSAFESSSSELKKMQPGDVLEVLEGPRKEDPPETLRLQGKASKDGKPGFVTFKDMAGNDNFTLAKLLVVKQSIAITTTFNISEGKSHRKLDVGEALEVLEGPQEDSTRGLNRVRAKAKKDGTEGWVTVQGNQGTAYAEESDKHYVCNKAVPLESKMETGSTLVRQIEEGEAFEAVGAPKAEKRDPIQRVKGRNLSDGSEGWFSIAGKSFVPWSSTYKCMQSTTLNEGLELKEAKTVRKLDVGEILEALQAPVKEPSAGLLRVRVRAKKDGVCGFATVKGNQGTVLLKPIFSVESSPSKEAPAASSVAPTKK